MTHTLTTTDRCETHTAVARVRHASAAILGLLLALVLLIL